MDWARILTEAGIAEPPWRVEALARLRAKQEGRAVQAVEAKAEKAAAKAARPTRAGMNLRARKKYL